MFYTIKSINTDVVVFEIDPLSGELRMLRPVSVEDTESGRYDLVIRATDQGMSKLCEQGKYKFLLAVLKIQFVQFSN